MLYSLGSIFDVISGITETKCHIIEPPLPIKDFIYCCDKHFHVENLKPLWLAKHHDKYGLIIITGDLCDFYLINDIGNYQKCYHKNINLAKKHRKGGQSQNRFQRLRIENIDSYITIMVDMVKEKFTNNGIPFIKKLFIVGNGDKKNLLFKKLPINLYQISSIFTINTSEINLNEIYQLLKSSGKFENNDVVDNLIKSFFELIELEPNKICYSKKDCTKLWNMGLVKYLIVHSSLKFNEPVNKNGTLFFVTDNFKVMEFGGVIGILHYNYN